MAFVRFPNPRLASNGTAMGQITWVSRNMTFITACFCRPLLMVSMWVSFIFCFTPSFLHFLNRHDLQGTGEIGRCGQLFSLRRSLGSLWWWCCGLAMDKGMAKNRERWLERLETMTMMITTTMRTNCFFFSRCWILTNITETRGWLLTNRRRLKQQVLLDEKWITCPRWCPGSRLWVYYTPQHIFFSLLLLLLDFLIIQASWHLLWQVMIVSHYWFPFSMFD